MTDLINLQEVEIAEQKRFFDNNLLIISKQLLVLQKSLQKKDKTLSKTLSRKDKVRILQGLGLVQTALTWKHKKHPWHTKN